MFQRFRGCRKALNSTLVFLYPYFLLTAPFARSVSPHRMTSVSQLDPDAPKARAVHCQEIFQQYLLYFTIPIDGHQPLIIAWTSSSNLCRASEAF